MKLSELVKKAVDGLEAQGCYSYERVCRYQLRREGVVLKCIAGQLINDDEYHGCLEGKGMSEGVSEGVIDAIQKSQGVFLDSSAVYVLRNLQGIHDYGAHNQDITTFAGQIVKMRDLTFTDHELAPLV